MTATPEELGQYLYEMLGWDEVKGEIPWGSLTEVERASWIVCAHKIADAHKYGVPWRRLQFPY